MPGRIYSALSSIPCVYLFSIVAMIVVKKNKKSKQNNNTVHGFTRPRYADVTSNNDSDNKYAVRKPNKVCFYCKNVAELQGCAL